MQKNINIAMGNEGMAMRDRRMSGEYFEATFNDGYGHLGSYTCEAGNPEDAVTEAVEVMKSYGDTKLGSGERIYIESVRRHYRAGRSSCSERIY